MKKGLSVLLIAAALFGFYGGAVNLNDVLACKDYWEEEGEKSTADMNKLEDGLNQLKDNEKAYLDGLDQVADGEEALAQGEEDYAAGQAELAKGEADYAAAPGKLAAGEKKLAAGKKELATGEKDYAAGKKKLAAGKAALAQGKKDLASLETLIGGITQVVEGYPEWKDGYEQLRNGRVEKVLKKVPTLTPMLTKVQTLLTKYEQTAALQKLGQASKILQTQAADITYTNDDYDQFNTALTSLKSALNTTAPILAAIDNQVTTTKNDAGSSGYTLSQVKQMLALDDVTLGVMKGAPDPSKAEDADAAAAAKQTATVYGRIAKNQLIGGVYSELGSQKDNFEELVANFDEADADTLNGVFQTIGTAVSKGTSATDAQAVANNTAWSDAGEVSKAVGDLIDILGTIHESIQGFQTMLNGYTAEKTGQLSQWIDGYAKLTGKEGVSGQKTLAGGVAQIIGGVYASKNNDLIKGLESAATAAKISNPKAYASTATSPLFKDINTSFEDFYQDMNKVDEAFKTVLPALKNTYTSGQDTLKAGQKEVSKGEKDLAAGKAKLAAGRKQLAAGEKELAQGYADYKAAPGKLAAGRAALAEGLQALMDGRAELAAGKDKLAEYEDGEQQVRDGLATLMGTEPDGGLTSILDRRNGDDDFDNGDTHLDLDEGLEAVEVGRGYQADSGVLITKEITNRAVGTAAGLGAGALAVLAAILSFLKKNKGAGISAILSAAAGGAGVAAGTSAGMEFSNIAGSAVGSTPWIAFGVLAGVALVHAIAHFASKEA